MKYYQLMLPLLLSGAQAQSARQQYAATCPSKDGQTEEILPGYTVKYKCASYKGGDTLSGVATPRDCASLCKNREGCAGSSWSTGKICVLGGAGDITTTDQKVVYMERIQERNPFEEGRNPFEGAGECEDELEDCEDSKQLLLSQLNTCNAQLAAAAVPVRCPGSNGQSALVDGKLWKLHCEKEASCLDSSTKVGPRDTLEDCILACSQQPNCAYLSWLPTSKNCWVSRGAKTFDQCPLVHSPNKFQTAQLLH